MKNFKLEGQWWLPETPEDKVPGTLEFSPHSGATLSVVGSLKEPGDHITARQREMMESERILGFSSNDKPITLWSCWESNKVNTATGFTKTSFHADIALVGAHVKGMKDIRFKKMLAEYQNLDQWAGISGLTLKRLNEDKAHRIVIEYNQPAPIVASVARAQIRLEFRPQFREDSGPIEEASIRQKALISFEYIESKHFEECSKMLRQFKNFLTLGVGEPVQLLALRGVVEKDEEPLVEIYYKPTGAKGSGKKMPPARMLFTLDDLQENFSHTLSNWFEKAETLGPVHDQYFSTAYGSPAYLDDRFLSMVQGVEAYHRRALATTELSEDEHEQRLQEIFDSAPDAHKDWLRNKLAYSNEPNLRKRLKEILHQNPEIMKFIFGTNAKKRKIFINKVVDTRNYLTHFDKSKEQAAAVGSELSIITRRLTAVLEACLLHDTGFDKDSLKKILSRKQGIPRGLL